MKKHVSIAAASVLLSFPLIASAQIAPSDTTRALDTLNRLEQKQETIIRSFQREQEQKAQERPKPSIEVPTAEEQEVQASKCFTVHTITLTGAEHLSSKRQQQLLEPYINQCLDIAAVNQLMRDITNHYINKGYVTSRVALPQQNIKDGSLEVQVIEGKVEAVTLNQNSRRDQWQVATAFPLVEDKILDLRDIEQGVDQINRLASSNATVQLTPGTQNGYTNVVVTDKPQGKTRATVGVDNSGQDSTGKVKGFASLEQDNLFGFGEAFTLNYNRNTGTDSNQKHSEIFSALASLPYGYWTLSANTSYSEYLTTVTGANQTFTSSGETKATGVKLDRVIHRNQNGKTSLNTGLTLKDTKNFIEDAELATGSRNLTVLKFGADHLHRAFGAIVYVSAGYERGLDAFGAKQDNNTSSQDPKAQFDKFTFDGSVYRPFAVHQAQLAYRMLASGQYSKDTLFSSEGMTIGDRYTVRGFQDDSLSGDSGGYIRNEVMLNLPLPTKNTHITNAIGALQPYIGLDIGGVEVNHGKGSGMLSGSAIGLRNNAGWLAFDLAVAAPISSPSFLPNQDPECYFSVSTKWEF